MEASPGHNSQKTLDEISDQEKIQITPPSQQPAGIQRQIDEDDVSPLRTVDWLFQADEEEGQTS